MTAARPRWILALAATAATLLILEATGRWALPTTPPREDGLVADPELGWTLPAGTQMSWRGTPAQINRIGLRGPEPSINPETRKVLIVGDSSVFGDGVEDGETLSRQLTAVLPPDYDVQNGGVPGYTCLQTRILFERIRAHFVPDVMVIYNMHSDYRRAGPHDRVIVEEQLGSLSATGVGKLLAAGTLWYRILRERPNLDVDAYGACLEGLASAHRETGSEVVFVWPITDVDFPDHPLYDQPDPSPVGLRLSDYRAAMKDVAAKMGGTLVDGPAAARAAGMSSKTALLDDVHPTGRGHGVLAQAIQKAIPPASAP